MAKITQTLRVVLLLMLATGVQARTWTSSDGVKTFGGDPQSYTLATGIVVVKQNDGKKTTLTFHQDELSAADATFLKEQGNTDPGKKPIKVFILAGQSNMKGRA